MIAYILKSSLSLLLLFGLYWFLLRKEKLFRFNRFFLIFSVIFSLIIPVITIPVYTTEDKSSSEILTAINSTLESFNPLPEQGEFPVKEPSILVSQYSEERNLQLPPGVILFLIYLAGVAIFASRFIQNLLYIKRQVSEAEKLEFSGYIIALTDQPVNPYSFVNTIVANKDDYRNDKISPELLQHEMEHLRQFHSLDLIFLELIRIIYWFNPIFLLYNSAVRMNHEYLADSGAVHEPADIENYAENLIGFICHQKNVRLSSGLNPSLTRKRLLMLTRSKPHKSNEGLI